MIWCCIIRLYGTNDYFPLSCVWKAQHLLKANVEHHQLWLKQKKQQLKRIEMKIDKKQKKIGKLDKQIQKFIDKTKADAEKRKWHIKKSIQLIPAGPQEKNT